MGMRFTKMVEPFVSRGLVVAGMSDAESPSSVGFVICILVSSICDDVRTTPDRCSSRGNLLENNTCVRCETDV